MIFQYRYAADGCMVTSVNGVRRYTWSVTLNENGVCIDHVVSGDGSSLDDCMDKARAEAARLNAIREAQESSPEVQRAIEQLRELPHTRRSS